MRRAAAICIAIMIIIPSAVSAQSMEWVREHAGALNPAITEVQGVSAAVPHTNEGIEARVRAYFSDAPILIPIAQCESRFRQFDTQGNPLDGGSGGMIGIFQINEGVHTHHALSLGMDIRTIEGNLAYARTLYDEGGTDPWLDSFSCWHPLSQGVSTGPLTQDLVLGAVNPEVLTLQKLLNTHGYVIASSGPGSSGLETSKFGALTRAAVRTFQCDHMQRCAGSEGATGFGMLDARTRDALLAFAGATSAPVSAPATVTTSASTTGDEVVRAALMHQIEDLSALLFSLKQKLGKN